MRVMLEQIVAGERVPAQADDGQHGDADPYAVELNVDGTTRTFVVFHRPTVLPGLAGGMLSADRLLQEMLRFEPVALGTLCQAVGAHIRGESLVLPLELPTHPDAQHPDETTPLSTPASTAQQRAAD